MMMLTIVAIPSRISNFNQEAFPFEVYLPVKREVRDVKFAGA